MRYTSPISNLTLYNTDGTPAYRFFNHVLIVGDPTSATDTIDATNLLVLYPSGATAAEKAGLGRLFFEAPPSSSAPTTEGWYEVLSGRVTHNGKIYESGGVFRFSTGDTVTLDNATIAAVPWWSRYGDEVARNQFAAEYFKLIYLEWGDEAQWTGKRAVSTFDFGSTR